ncbi:MAG TPA: hypothetical protein VFB82_00180 [Blastocatellia bacterium]|nr:hypothetical protein [Blastocatellia bacterium]
MKAINSLKTPHKSKAVQVAIGVRVKSGRAIAVLVAGPAESPAVLARREIKLCDPAEPDSMQPYHAALDMTGAKGARMIERLVKVVRRATNGSIAELLSDWRGAGHELRGAALVVGSLIDPAKIPNDHIRAHALEGQLFRVSVQEAVVENGLTSVVFTERDVYSTAAAALGRSEDDLKRVASELGRAAAGPWRADEKTAALAAWMVLAGTRKRANK